MIREPYWSFTARGEDRELGAVHGFARTDHMVAVCGGRSTLVLSPHNGVSSSELVPIGVLEPKR